jgi:hypothetical protein
MVMITMEIMDFPITLMIATGMGNSYLFKLG